jgi:hypothetical protein
MFVGRPTVPPGTVAVEWAGLTAPAPTVLVNGLPLRAVPFMVTATRSVPTAVGV